MTEVLQFAAAFLAGLALGGFFFGGLWWTVRRGLGAQRVALWFLCSLLVRSAVVLLGFYVLLGNDWRRLVAGLVGFTVARTVVTRLTRAANGASHDASEARHAP